MILMVREQLGHLAMVSPWPIASRVIWNLSPQGQG